MFVGRHQEMAELNAALDDAMAGRGRLIMLAGEPGIGKTSIARELTSHASDLGAQVLWGWCYEREGAPPYWPWVQPIKAYVAGTSSDQLLAQMGSGAADIADLIPEIRQKLPDLEIPLALDPEQTRFRLFNSIATFLKTMAQPQSLVVVLDDLHWSDTSSLLLLEFLAQQMAESNLLVIGAYRDVEINRQHPLTESLARLSRSASFHRLGLGGLESDAVGQYVRESGGENASSEMIDAIHAHTEGNPLFVSEVVQLLRDQDGLESAAGAATPLALGLPQGVIEAIGQRLNRLSEPCVDALTVAAVIGRQFDFNLLKYISQDISEFQLLESMDEALEPHILQEIPGQRDRYQFSHALVQQTLLERLSTSRRVRMHARVGEELEKQYGEQPGEHAAELAYHFSESSPLTGPDKLVKYAGLAGERALRGYAWEEAITHFNLGVSAKGGLVEDGQSADLMFGLGQAEINAGRVHEGWETLKKAFDYYVGAGDQAKFVAVAELPLPFVTGLQDPARLTRQALDLVPPGSHEQGRLWCDYGNKLGMLTSDYSGASEAFANALSIAQRENDAKLEMRIWASSAQMNYWTLHIEDCIDASLKAIDLARDHDEPLTQVMGHYYAALALRVVGDLAGVRQQATAILPLAEKRQDRFWLASALSSAAVPHLMTGNWADAKEFLLRGLDVWPIDSRLLGALMQAEYQSGRFEQGMAAQEQLLDVLRSGRFSTPVAKAILALSLPIYANVSGESDTFVDHIQGAEDVVASPSSSLGLVLWARVGLAYSAVLKNDAAEAKVQYREIQLASGQMLLSVCSDRILGLLSHVMGEPRQADLHFEDALNFCRQAGYRPEYAWTCHDYADFLLKRNERGYRSRITELLDESLEISTELSMLPLTEKVAALQERAASRSTRASTFPGGLAQWEVEVLRHISGGKTDREIGEELFISVKTVGNHVSNILNKTGSANRTEAATFAALNGLTARQ